MSLIKRITELPDLDWMDNSRREMAVTGQELISETDFVWQIGNVAVAGFIYHSFLSSPWMWFVLSRNITIGDLLDFRRLAIQIPLGTLTAVRQDYKVGLRFAEFYGFKSTDEIHDYGESKYIIFRRV